MVCVSIATLEKSMRTASAPDLLSSVKFPLSFSSLVTLCDESSIHCPVTMSSSEVKSYGHNSAIGIRLALLSCLSLQCVFYVRVSTFGNAQDLVSCHQLRSSRPVPTKSMSLASGCSVITSQTVSRSPSQCTVCNCLLLSSLYDPDPDPDPEVRCLLSYCLLDYFCCCR